MQGPRTLCFKGIAAFAFRGARLVGRVSQRARRADGMRHGRAGNAAEFSFALRRTLALRPHGRALHAPPRREKCCQRR